MAAFPATPILDTGQGAAQSPLPEGNPWISGIEAGTAGHSLSRDGIGGLYATEDDVESRWPTVFSANQEVYGRLTTAPLSGERVLLCNRIRLPSLNCYILIYLQGGGVSTYQLSKWVAGSFTALATAAGFQVVAGDWLGLQAIGDTIRVFAKRSAGDWVQLISRTDTSIPAAAGGQIGLGMTGAGHAAIWSNFGGGAIVEPAQSGIIIAGRGASR